MDALRILILAAGKGTRMRSEKAKVLHTICGVPLIQYVCNAASKLDHRGIYAVVGEGMEEVKRTLENQGLTFIHQEQQLGTGHAVLAAAPALQAQSGDLLILYGDMPLLSTELLESLIDAHRRSKAAVTMLTARLDTPYGYGRIVRTPAGDIARIVEERDASDAERAISEINTGIYCFDLKALFAALGQISNRNAQNEYYLTDVIGILNANGKAVAGVLAPDPAQVIGINTRYELSQVESRVRAALLKRLMESGVSIIDPASTYIEASVSIGQDTVIYPNAILEKNTRIGSFCTIHAASHLVNAEIADHVTVRDSTIITDSSVGAYSTVGPFAHVREHTRVGTHCRVGNFVEIKKSILGDKTKAAHLAYIGDAELGVGVNIGAGTITCNYDGVRKNKTIVEDGVFIGSDSQLVAPVRIGKGAYVAAGSTITQDVPPYALGIARGRQSIKKDWVHTRTRSSDRPTQPESDKSLKRE